MHQTTQPVYPARSYIPCADLCVITTYYNPAAYETKMVNYRRFAEALERSGIALYTIELAFGDDPFALPAVPTTFRVRGRDIIWQKERLMNLLMREVPERYTKIIWLDCDVLFSNPDWAVASSAALDRYQVIQPFEWAVRLPRNELQYDQDGELHEGFAALNSRTAHRNADHFDLHGHTGYAWGIRRETLDRHGFYDACISGSGDHLMAHAFYGDIDTRCVYRMIGTGRYFDHFSKWANKIYESVHGAVGFVPGYLLHLWHGDTSDRRYFERNQELIGMNFDPAQDLALDASGLLMWSEDNPGLRTWAVEFFSARKEDGVSTEPLAH